MAKPPESTKTSLRQRLTAHARDRWPQLTDVLVRYRGAFAYVDGQLPDGTTLPLCRLRYGGSAHTWGFAIYRASHEDYEPSILPTGYPPAPPKKPSTAQQASTSPTHRLAHPATPDELTGPTTSGSLLIREVEVQAAACCDRVQEGLQLRGRRCLGPGRPPSLQGDPGGKPGAYRA